MAEEEVVETEEEVEENPVEALARELGWNPDWEGPEEERVGAEDYIRRQQTIMQRSSQDIGSLKSSISEMQRKMQEMAESHGRQTQAALEAQKQRLMEERSKAVEEGDTEAFKKADKQLNELSEPPPQTDPRVADFQKGLEKFRKENTWFDTDADLHAEAIIAAQTIGDMHPDISADDFYGKVVDLVRERRPEKFAAPSNKPTQVSGDRPKSKSKSKWDELITQNPEIEGIFEQSVKMGAYKDTKEDREKYAKAVLDSE